MIRDGKGAGSRMRGKGRLAGLALAASLLASPALAASGAESRNSLGVGAVVVQTCRLSTEEATVAGSGHVSCSIATSLPAITTAPTPVDRVQPSSAGGDRTRYITITY